MKKKDFGKLVSSRIEMVVPNKDYYNVLLSDSELRLLLKCLNFCFEMSFFCKDGNRLSKLFDYLDSFKLRL